MRYSWEQPVLGSGGGPRRALPLLVDVPADDESFLMVNGDTLTSLSLTSFAAAHRDSGALVTMALIENPRPDVYGGVRVEAGWVRGFTRAGSGEPSYHFIGVQAAQARAFLELEDGVPAESVMGLYPRLIARTPGRSSDTSSMRRSATSARRPITCRPRCGSLPPRATGWSAVEAFPSIRRRQLEETAVWDDVTIGKNCTLEECIVCDGVQVPAGSSYRRQRWCSPRDRPFSRTSASRAVCCCGRFETAPPGAPCRG